MKRTIKSPTINHLLDPEFNDAGDDLLPVGEPHNTPHGTFLGQSFGGWDELARQVRNPETYRTSWFFDTNAVILPASAPFWDALQTTFARTLSGHKAFLASPIRRELREWLNAPFRKKELAADMNRCLENKRGFLGLFSTADEHTEWQPIVEYYTRLIGQRRLLAVPLEDGLTVWGQDATQKSLVMSKIAHLEGERSVLLAKAGRKDFEDKGGVCFNDPELVVLTFLYAILSKRQTVLVTTDSQVFDDFQKMQWFLDTHYHAWLVSQKLHTGMYGKPLKMRTEKSDIVFDGDCECYEKKSTTFSEIMYSKESYHQIFVMHIESNGVINHRGLQIGSDVIGMLTAKKDSGGMNSSLYHPSNVHIDMAPLFGDFGSYIGVAIDKTVPICDTMCISILDFNHACRSFERYHSPKQSRKFDWSPN